MRSVLLLPVVVICVGMALLADGIAERRKHAYNWHPAWSPAPLNEGSSVALAFKADQSISYDIRFEISTHDSSSDCLTGPPVGKSADCHAAVDALEAEWEVAVEGKPFASGTSRGALGANSSQGEIDKTMGAFAAESGKNYTVIVRFSKPLMPFSKVRPRVSIWGDRQAFKTWNFKFGGAPNEAGLILLVGLVWFLVVRARSAQTAASA